LLNQTAVGQFLEYRPRSHRRPGGTL